MAFKMASSTIAAAVMLAAASSAWADVKAGVDAWAAGNYEAAVREWEGLAARGDPDAQFNLAQAYRLGRGVPRDDGKAQELYSMAASQGHLQAADNYGMMLFQAGRREEAMPYVQAAADRGDPRAQYLLGIAHFNGDVVAKDWPRAYALMTLANSAGLPQAAPAISEMDKYISLAERQKGVALSGDIQKSAEARLAQQLAALDLGVAPSAIQPVPAAPKPEPALAPAPTPAPAPATAPPKIAASPRVPGVIEAAPVAPSVAAAEAAVAEAIRVTGTESPAEAGADYARPPAPPARVAATAPAASAPKPAAPAPEKPAPAAASAPAASASAASAPAAATGPWRVQLGSFSIPANAEKMWAQLGGKGVLAGKSKLVSQSGKLTILSAGGFASREAASSACAALKRSGQSCLVGR